MLYVVEEKKGKTVVYFISIISNERLLVPIRSLLKENYSRHRSSALHHPLEILHSNLIIPIYTPSVYVRSLYKTPNSFICAFLSVNNKIYYQMQLIS